MLHFQKQYKAAKLIIEVFCSVEEVCTFFFQRINASEEKNIEHKV
jgi:hypothetical protein